MPVRGTKHDKDLPQLALRDVFTDSSKRSMWFVLPILLILTKAGNPLLKAVFGLTLYKQYKPGIKPRLPVVS
ncbi:hypothetical protein IAQ61_011301 [Plenodomus lingam]|uniref:uncharacterized protein n=1 Tax=Leptosphaeria maculans TaxID=5022 RepID=UPI00331BE6FF|nr:hypothetical protein IAQ61_011301 [Plenodomus lingam]